VSGEGGELANRLLAQIIREIAEVGIGGREFQIFEGDLRFSGKIG